MKYEKNKLWASPTSSERLKTAEKYDHFRATQRHILIISPKKPKGFIEIKGELANKLPAEDIQWILSESAWLAAEEETKYHDELLTYSKSFLERLENELKKAAEEADLKEGLTDAGSETSAGDQAPTE